VCGFVAPSLLGWGWPRGLANDQPGIISMRQGGSDLSATDPWATNTDACVESPPHDLIMWPFDPNTTGLPTTPSTMGTGIMGANTPYAHLMGNQNPMPSDTGSPARP